MPSFSLKPGAICGCTFLMTFHVDRTAVNADGDEFEFPTIKQLLEDFEIDFSEHAKEG
ncbi:MAG: hypothetical protein GXY64_11400 [Bacteroidales bacterium]|nr:hypothetical protein [Bacteroidales bacterium]